MSHRNKLVVPGVDNMMNNYKEEIAEEFGIHFSPASRDVITRRLVDEAKKDKEKTRNNEDMR